MSALQTYIVWHSFPYDTETQGFKCQAEDTEHATEQCLDAYPDCSIVEVEVSSGEG